MDVMLEREQRRVPDTVIYMRITLPIKILFATALVVAALFFGTSSALAQATHISGQDYLNRVNEQRVAAGQTPLAGGSATALVNRINAMGDTEFNALQQVNNGRPSWISDLGQIGIATSRATQNPDGTTNTAAVNQVAAENQLQNPGSTSCIPFYSFEFVKCIGTPLAIWTSSLMLSFGGAILRLAGAVFDFGVNHVIIDFKNTLSGSLIDIINSGWTFFRDLANILIIGIFVFIAISLILGLKEYGQKKLVARVLLIAVLMNFSLLFTKIVIDASNFVAFAIYTQTAGAGGAQTFSVADKVLAPLHITGTWDTSKLAATVAGQASGGAGAFKAFAFGVFGFLILTVLAAVIFYGAFLILARAIMFIFLMLTAPIAYATYLAPHFEASEFGWTNWWKSLINNAAFAPLLMVFLSVSILIMQTASPSVNPADTIGALLVDPSKQVLTDGWRVLFVYIIGTGLLFTSFRLSSSLAGSISGIRLGQMAAGMPLALGFAGAAKAAQYTVGRGLSKVADSKGAQAQAARMQAFRSGKAEDFARAEQLRKQKDMLEKGSRSSFNLMNTRLGKALNGGLGGVLGGETKGNFKDDMHAKAVAAEEAAKAAIMSGKDKDAIRKEAEKAELETHKKDLDTAAKNLEVAKTQLDKARTDAAAADDPTLKAQAEADASKRGQEKQPELERAKQEVRVVEEKRTEIASGHQTEINTMMKKAESMSGTAHDEQIRAIEAKKAEHATAIKQQDERITAARDKVSTIDLEINQPTRVLAERQKKAREEMALREKDFKGAETHLKQLQGTDEKKLKAVAKDKANKIIAKGEEHSGEELHRIATKQAGILGGETGAHEIQHHFDEKFKKKSGAESIAETLKEMNKPKDDAAH